MDAGNGYIEQNQVNGLVLQDSQHFFAASGLCADDNVMFPFEQLFQAFAHQCVIVDN
jgi:hypothetical protein